MALINQQYGRQGQANVVLYPLAQQMHSAFHDITVGGNNVPTFTTSQYYFATPGYDQASGLGSVDANVLVDNWSSIHFLPTATTLSLSSATITHGQPVTVSTTVMPASGSGTPSGNVAILTDSSLPSNRSQLFLALTNGTASGGINIFPGGTYHVFADYGGDDVFGMSKSSPAVLTVRPESANLNFAAVVAQPFSTPTAITNGGTVPYGALLTLGIQPTGVSAAPGNTNGVATGTATFSVDSNTTTVPLDSAGIAVWPAPTLTLGSHTAGASYSGDSSFSAGTASQLSLVVAKAQPVVSFQMPEDVSLRSGDSITISVAVGTPFPGIGTPPTGTVTVSLGTLAQTVALSVINNYKSAALVTFSNLSAQCYDFPAASYSGDSNWLPAGGGIDGALCVSPGTNAPTMTALTITPGSISGAQTATFTATVSSPSGSATSPTGFISFFDNGAFLFNQLLPSNSTGGSSSVQVTGIYPSDFLTNGANQITAVYTGDCCNSPSSSTPASIMVVSNSPDFTLTPQVPQILIKAGSSGNVTLNVSSLAGFNGIVDLTCIPSSKNLTCSLMPASLSVNGAASATININALSGASQSSSVRPSTHFNVAGFFMLACICLGGSSRQRKWMVICGFALMAVLLFIASCGGGGQQRVQPPVPTAPNTSYYTVLVSATGDGVIHNSQIIVAVQ
ncbi:MAG: Ig-like domain repeat protein [Terriglobales bacterium]